MTRVRLLWSFAPLAMLLIILLVVSCAQTGMGHGDRGRWRRQNLHGGGPLSIRKRVSLLPFFNDATQRGMDLSGMATEELRGELSRSQDLIVDSRATAEFFVSSKQIYSGGGTELGKLAGRAKRSGIGLILYGRIISSRLRENTDDVGFFRKSRAYAQVSIEVRIFDVNSNREIFGQVFKGQVSNENFRLYRGDQEDKRAYQQQIMRHAVRLAVRRSFPHIVKSAQKMEWMGRIAKIIGTKIYINAGRESGVKIGDVMKVITEGTEIYDPETGALIGVSKGEAKGTLEVIDFFGPDGSISVLHSGGSVVEGDFVQLYGE